MLKHLQSVPIKCCMGLVPKSSMFQKTPLLSVKYDEKPRNTGRDAESCELRDSVLLRSPGSVITS